MRYLWIFVFFVLSHSLSFAAQNAKITEPSVEVYAQADFDSDVIGEVHENETYRISNKNYGPFYRIKLKDGQIGYIVDYVLDIEGNGRIRPLDYDQRMLDEARKDQKKGQKDVEADDSDFFDQAADQAEEEEFFGKTYAGPTLSLINYHEDTMGSVQVADLFAVGYKSLADLSWSVMATWGAPAYYADKTGGSASGGQLWGDVGFSTAIAHLQRNEIRVGGGVFAHLSLLNVKTPAQSYDLHDLTAGVNLEGDFVYKFARSEMIFSLKYYFDKSSYAGFGIGYLF